MKLSFIQKILSKLRLYRTNQRISQSAIVIESCLGQNISIGDNCYLYRITLGNYSYLSKGVCVMNTSIGKFCSIAEGTIIGGGMHPSKTFVSTSPVFFSINKQCGATFSDQSYFREMGNTIIGNDVWIGAHAIIIDDICIGDGAIVGAGSIVTKDVEPYSIVAGNPAKLVRYRFEPEEIDFLLNFKWWEKDEKWVRLNFRDFHNIALFKQKYDHH